MILLWLFTARPCPLGDLTKQRRVELLRRYRKRLGERRSADWAAFVLVG